MLLINSQQQVVGFYKTKKEMGELKEGDTVIKTLKAAKEQGFGDKWVELRPKKERAEGAKRTRVVVPKEGAYTVVKSTAVRKGDNADRNDQFELLFSKTRLEDFFAEAKEFNAGEKMKVTPASLVGYAIRKGIIQLAA